MEKNIQKTNSNYSNYKQDKLLVHVGSLRRCAMTNKYFVPSMQVGITDKCFNKCPMCGHWKRANKYDMPIGNYLQFLNVAANNGLESIGYSGGDPFAYSGMNTLIEWHILNEVLFGIVTAGYVPDSINIENLWQASWIRMSIDTVDEDLYNKIRGGMPFKAVHDSINKLLINGCENLHIGAVLHKNNINAELGTTTIKKLVAFAIDNDFVAIRFWLARKHSLHNFDSSMAEAVREELLIAKENLQSKDIDNNIDTTLEIMDGKISPNFNRCYNAMYQCFVDARGNVFPCCSLAGDTEIASRCQPLFNILKVKDDNSYNDFAKACHNFSNIPTDKLPKGCSEECVPKLIVANNIVEEWWNEKHFF